MANASTHKKINQDKNNEYFMAFIDEFKSESDRAAVILGAAKLDNILYQILNKILLPPPSGNDELLDNDNPLSTFSSRINICYRLGLIDAEFSRTLHLIRKIRNTFAHEISWANLNSGNYWDRIREMSNIFKQCKEYFKLQDMLFDSDKSHSTDFKSVLTISMVRLNIIMDSPYNWISINNTTPLSIRPTNRTRNK